MKIDSISPEFSDGAPKIAGAIIRDRIDTVQNALDVLKTSTSAMGIVEYLQPEYQSYVNPEPPTKIPNASTEATSSNVVYQNINTSPHSLLLEKVEEAHNQQAIKEATTNEAARLATVNSLAEHRLAAASKPYAHQYEQQAQNVKKAA